MKNFPRILVITPVSHISNFIARVNSFACADFLDDPSVNEVLPIIGKYDAIFTNPNKSKIFIDKTIIDAAYNLKVICTASTGTNHIDKKYAKLKNIPVLSLTNERDVIEKISSTAELAFALTLVSIRNIIPAYNSVLRGEWDYTNYIGRQLNGLIIGVIGAGRLGKKYISYCKVFGAKILVYDPYKVIKSNGQISQVDDIKQIFRQSDVIALHVHVSEETENFINNKSFSLMKSDVTLINTSRGDLINEIDMVNFLKKNPNAKIVSDVIANEIKGRLSSPLYKLRKRSKQVIITPHIGGMTKEAQEIAYLHAIFMLEQFFL
jgi:phosphoglycerate dehydrogenase-like enzyme